MFVIDIEGRGKSASRNGIISIGVCVGIKSGEDVPRVLEKRRFNLLPLPGQSMDSECQAQFWDKQPPDLLATLERDATPALQGIALFRQYLDHWIDQDPELYVLCDTPA